MRLRLLAVLAATALAGTPAQGAVNRPQVVDPKGDVRGGLAELDIVSARWSTTGRGANMRLVGTLTLAATPMKDAPFVYEMRSEVRGCGTVLFEYTPGSLMTYAQVAGPPVSDGDTSAGIWLACGGDGGATTQSTMLFKQVTFTRSGNALSWSVPVSALPKQVAPGAVFFDFNAVADIGEPVFGLTFASDTAQGLDVAYGDGTWRMR